ncbi:hypothetical protein [uncultured Algibacter sp.]|uniref:hypothetical protein n=1 Tax=uncultured Algibacter sp. TaxID=298659 RepID=UPI002634B45A|nr:hypothetical protein [uncultured Algibacter sp.]
MKTKLLIPFLSVLIIATFSCKTSDDIFCTDIFVYGLSITVKDANTDAVITENITIKATDGDYEETLMSIESSNAFVGAGERAGTYILTINATNYKDYITEPIKVSADECHVIPEAIEIMLQPN